MRTFFALAALLLTSCTSGPRSVLAPTPDPVAGSPATIALRVIAGTGPQAGTATVAAVVQDPFGRIVTGQAVHFVASAGALDASDAMTDATGTASTGLHCTETARVTATAGAISATATVVAAPPPPPLPPSVPPILTPPPPPPPPAAITVSGPSAGTTGKALVFTIGGLATAGPFRWTWGDGSILQSEAFTASHTYGAAGTYTVSVSGSSASARAVTVITDAPAPTPTPTPDPTALTVTLACTPQTHGAATPCNVTVADSTGALVTASLSTVDWDWGDGTLTPAGGAFATHVYAVMGTYTVQATAKIAPAKTGAAQKTILVP